MKKNTILLAFLVSTQTFAGTYLDLGLGILHRNLEGDQQSYKSHSGALTELSLGYSWDKWDLALDGSYSIGRQKGMKFIYPVATIDDDFNMSSVNVGPTLKYHIKSESGNWEYVPFVGAFYSYTVFQNSKELVDDLRNEKEDNSQETWGYGGKLGVEFKKLTPDSSWADSVNYKLFASYTKFRDIEGDYQSGNTVKEYRGDTPDNLEDYSIGLSVGFSIGDKLAKKVWNSAKKVADL